MSAIYDHDSSAERVLYSPHKALDAVLDLGAIPKRLFRVFYPIWMVEVEGRQRVATDFEEIEWFIERGVHEAGLTSITGLAQFFGLGPRFVRKLVRFLEGIGHISGDENHLALTELGVSSVQDRVRYKEEETSTKLYFDGLESRPLSREHYRIPVYDDISQNTAFQAFYHFSHRWDRGALQNLIARPDRQQYNLPDEVTQVTLLGREPAYLPVYVVERWEDESVDYSSLLVFSRIQSMRDMVLEEVVNVNPLTLVLLHTARAHDLERAVKDYLGRRGLSQDDWYLQRDGCWGAQVMVDARVLKPVSHHVGDAEKSWGLTVRDVGGYILVYDWCVWLTCDDPDVRQQAALERLVEWLQYVTRMPTSEELYQRLSLMRERLHIEPISTETLMDMAQQRGLARALERLDMLMTDNEQM